MDILHCSLIYSHAVQRRNYVFIKQHSIISTLFRFSMAVKHSLTKNLISFSFFNEIQNSKCPRKLFNKITKLRNSLGIINIFNSQCDVEDKAILMVIANLISYVSFCMRILEP